VIETLASRARSFLIGVAVLLLLAPSFAALAEILPRISTEQVYVDTPFSVTFELSGTDSANPDLSALEQHFSIIGRSRANHLTLENGRVQRKQQLTLTLAARQAGEIELPSIDFGNVRSRPVTLTVQAQDSMPSKGEQVRLEVSLDPEEVLVQQQVVVSVRVLRPRSVDLDSARLSDPVVSGGDAMIESLGKDRAFTLERDGVTFDAIERRFAVIPQSSGLLTLEPLLLDARRVSGGLGLSNPFGVQIQPIQLRSEARQIRVKPAPELPSGERWLPAAALTLTEAWSGLDEAGRARVGEPVVRTIGVLADGVTAVQLPELAHPVPDSINQYLESPSLATQGNPDGLSAQRTEKRILIPVKAGRVELPAVELRWWNLEQGRIDTASLPARTVEVLPAAGSAVESGQGALDSQGTMAESAKAEEADELADGGVTNADPSEGTADFLPQSTPKALLWLLAGILVGALSTRAWRRSAPDGSASPGSERAVLPSKSFRDLLARAADAAGRDDAEAAQRGLIDLASQWPLRIGCSHGPLRSLAELEEQTGDDALRDAIRDLQKHRYGAPDACGGQWRGHALREALLAIRSRDAGASGTVAKEDIRLPPLKPDAHAG
jgi:hypothetical protein